MTYKAKYSGNLCYILTDILPQDDQCRLTSFSLKHKIDDRQYPCDISLKGEFPPEVDFSKDI